MLRLLMTILEIDSPPQVIRIAAIVLSVQMYIYGRQIQITKYLIVYDVIYD